VVTGDQIARILGFLKQHYDYVIVDTSKSFSPPTLATFEQADQIFLVTTVDVPSLRNIARCLPLLTQMAAPAEDRLRLVLNRYLDDGLIRIPDVERTLGVKVYQTIGNDYDAIVRSINTGTPIILDRESRFAHDIRMLGAAISGFQVSGDARTGRMKRTLVDPLSRMWRRTFVREPEVGA
jgi:pilus assembly protein CpaE